MLVGNNKLVGITGPAPDPSHPYDNPGYIDPNANLVTNSAFWGNADGDVYHVKLDGTDHTVQQQNAITPTFYSMDINSPYYMYLDPSCDSQITHGASDGSYMGARPMVPEPAMAGLLLCGVASFLGFVSFRRLIA